MVNGSNDLKIKPFCRELRWKEPASNSSVMDPDLGPRSPGSPGLGPAKSYGEQTEAGPLYDSTQNHKHSCSTFDRNQGSIVRSGDHHKGNTMNSWSANSLNQALSMNTQSALGSSNQFGHEKNQEIDAVEAYFECITTCSLDDGECITTCTEILREHS